MNTPTAEAIALARRFHAAYERLAPDFGYETRADTKTFDPESANGKLMIAVCAEIDASRAEQAGGDVFRCDFCGSDYTHAKFCCQNRRDYLNVHGIREKPEGDEAQQLADDMRNYGITFTKGGKRIDPLDVFIDPQRPEGGEWVTVPAKLTPEMKAAWTAAQPKGFGTSYSLGKGYAALLAAAPVPPAVGEDDGVNYEQVVELLITGGFTTREKADHAKRILFPDQQADKAGERDGR